MSGNFVFIIFHFVPTLHLARNQLGPSNIKISGLNLACLFKDMIILNYSSFSKRKWKCFEIEFEKTLKAQMSNNLILFL